MHKKMLMICTAAALFLSPFTSSAENPRERIDFWQNNYTELSSKADPRAEKAHTIFRRVLNAAGTRYGILPRLFIIKDDSLNVISIPDGWIILTKGSLDVCYKDPERGDDLLAFVLGHEIAHQLKDDFWHMQFFQAVEASGMDDAQNKEVLEDIKKIVGLTDKVLAKELEADRLGIVYASMAGYDASAIVSEDDKGNFFQEWVSYLDPANIKGIHKDATHPSPEERAGAVKVELKNVIKHLEYFHMGLKFYQAGDYRRAILAFEKFLRVFPSREVYHDLASSHHQLALEHYRKWKGDDQRIPFKLSISVDPETRAGGITLRSSDPEGPQALFYKHIGKAIEFYEMAISGDPLYALSYINLGAAFIIKGEPYEAIAKLKRALKIDAVSKNKLLKARVLNNLGVAFYSAENIGKARKILEEASGLNSEYGDPLFNLGKIEWEEKKEDRAGKYWMAYLKVDAAGPWAKLIIKTLSLEKPAGTPGSESTMSAEKVMGVEKGDYDEDVPDDKGTPECTEMPLEEEPFRICTFKNGVKTVSQEDEIVMIVTSEGYRGKSAGGISIGASESGVLTAYGPPSKLLNMTQGESWIYQSQGITFQFRDNKVVSWILF
jgi:tetratricopeptide (TPR) repeat protein